MLTNDSQFLYGNPSDVNSSEQHKFTGVRVTLASASWFPAAGGERWGGWEGVLLASVLVCYESFHPG